MKLHITAPLPPSLNNAYPSNKSGRRFLSKEGSVYKQILALRVKQAAREQGFSVPEGARLSFTLRLYFPDRRRTDIDNRVKLPLDAVCAALSVDDSTVDSIQVTRGAVDKVAPRCTIILEVEQVKA